MSRDRYSRGIGGQRSNFGPMWSGDSGSSSMYNDFESRNNRGSRSGNLAPLMDLRSGMSRMDDDEDFTIDTYGPSKSYGSTGISGKTPEQIAFDTEFEKWEKSFEDWKLNNRNHPDPDQYRMYEQKFLDVRSKLLKKRREIYGEGSRSGSGKSPFDSQLSAADAMANSILTKFGSPSGRKSSGGRGNRSGGGGNDGDRGGSSDILNNELILTALKVISGGMGGMNSPMGGMNGPMGGMSGPMGSPMGGSMGSSMGGPMSNRGYGSGYGYGRGYDDGPYGSGYGRGYSGSGYGRSGYNDDFGRGYGNSSRLGPRRPGGDSRLGPKKTTVSRNDPKKADAEKKRKRKKKPKKEKVLKDGEIDSRLPFLDRIPIMYEEARKNECPKLLSGSANRRMKDLKAKEPEKLTEREKLFMEYAEYVYNKREEYFKAHPQERNAAQKAKTEDVPMEEKAEESTAAPAESAKADEKVDTKVDDVEMNEDELLKD